MKYMKKALLLILSAVAVTTLYANHPDSVYIRPDVREGVRDFQIAYSTDGVRWTHLDYTLFSSDYGPWGKQKKMFYPVLAYEGGRYKATFVPDTLLNDIAATESSDALLWKPQDYTTLSPKDFAVFKDRQKSLSKNNVVCVPWTDFQALMDRKKLAELNMQWEQENFVETGKYLVGVKEVNARLSIDKANKKAISNNLVGVFFEDISYAADGGIYAELIQNRDFEYTAGDRKGWTSKTAWRMDGDGTDWTISTDNPIHKNNSHYAVLNTTRVGARLVNDGWDGIALQGGGKYLLSLFTRGKGKVKVSLVDGTHELASTVVKCAGTWKQVSATLTPAQSAKTASLVIEPLEEGVVEVDFVSLFPKDTYKGRKNGLRRDLAEAVEAIKPRFVRFPGGCATHGNGIDNIYHWQSSIGELWERESDFNIWNYHQTRGLGFYEYFQFCEDLGALALPVLAAGVPCQNSSRGGNGQQGGIPFEKDLNGKPSPYTYNGKPLTMESYLQELLDLIEWANGDPKTSALARQRAKAGHPKPFNLKYLGIGNEDLISDLFLERYNFLTEGVKRVHPEITIVGTVGPFWEGSDYEYGWNDAKNTKKEIVDEHYYNTPGWYFHHRDFYDRYDRNGTKVYLGEWASKGNNVSNALVEAAYMTNVERNADVVVMSSYAPLLAKEGHTSWNPDLIYFNNTEVKPTANYYVQRAFGQNSGDTYIYSDVFVDLDNVKGAARKDIPNRIDKSVVTDSSTGDMIIKMVSMLPCVTNVTLEGIGSEQRNAKVSVLSSVGAPDKERQWTADTTCDITVKDGTVVTLPSYSFVVIRIPAAKK